MRVNCFIFSFYTSNASYLKLEFDRRLCLLEIVAFDL